MPAQRRLTQSYLGFSPQRTLCLTPRPPQPPPEALGQCYINRLPDELLAKILSYLPPQPILSEPPTYEQCPPIVLICKRWERNYDATLYQTISFVEPRWHHCHPRQIVQTLRQQTHLRHHVRHISVEMMFMGQTTNREITDIINSCPGVRNVSLHLTWSNKVWPIIHALERLPRLVVLCLSGYDCGPSLQMILGHFNHPTLRELRLHRYGLARGDTPRAPWLPIEPPSQDEMDKFSVVAHSRSSAIRSLVLSDPSCSPHCTSTLLQWPLNLVRLSLTQLLGSIYGLDYTLDAVELILSIHRESLQHITVSIIPPRPNEHGAWITSGIPDFSKFRNLRRLQLASRNLLAESPSQAAAKLAAPVLRHLTMDFWAENQHPEPCTAFAEDQVLWIGEFANQYPTREPTTRLQNIFVEFNPDYDIQYHEETMKWPWEYLQEAVRKLSHYGMTMGYSEPACTKDEWDSIGRENRKLGTVKRLSHGSNQGLV